MACVTDSGDIGQSEDAGGGAVFFVQKRVGKNGKSFECHKFRSMTVSHGGSSISVAGESRITPLGAKLRHYKLDELPELWCLSGT